MKKKFRSLNRKERVLLSDVLPYETPPIFSNRSFFDFVVDNRIEIRNDTIFWVKQGNALREAVKILFGGKDDSQIKNDINGELQFDLKKRGLNSVPFKFKIAHNTDFRELAIIHPKNQLEIVSFYEKYKDSLIYFCGQSPVSIRKPFGIARFVVHKDLTHLNHLAFDHDHTSIEEYDKEYASLKTYFTYKSVSNIYKFYESYKYHRCEKKYEKLFKFDISKCFDSIYTHCLAWGIYNKEIIKMSIEASSNTMAGKFDRLMQGMNDGETNGIVIGPEFSRIFSELILQQIDVLAFEEIRNSPLQCIHKRDFEIFRYVDDYFLFYNDDRVKNEVFNTFKSNLKKFKLFINDNKTKDIERPIITQLTLAKGRITELINTHLQLTRVIPNEVEGNEELEPIYFSSNRTITKFKAIILESGVTYGDVLNYSLACIDKKVLNLIQSTKSSDIGSENIPKFVRVILEVLDFTFFLYSSAPKVNTTIKLSMILSKIIGFARVSKILNFDQRHLILKRIFDDSLLRLKCNIPNEFSQMETLYLIIIIKTLGKEYRIGEELLASYFLIDIDQMTWQYMPNYFSIVVLLFYIENKKRYSRIKTVLEKIIFQKFSAMPLYQRNRSTEAILLFFDLIACPYIARLFKNKLFNLFEIRHGKIRSEFINLRKTWFTKWTDFDLMKEIEAKRSFEPY